MSVDSSRLGPSHSREAGLTGALLGSMPKQGQGKNRTLFGDSTRLTQVANNTHPPQWVVPPILTLALLHGFGSHLLAFELLHLPT